MDFRILGPLQVLDEGRDVTPAGAKQRALLALLVLHANETLSNERLVDELWGEHPPLTAPKTMQVHISRLRKALEGGGGSASPEVVITRDHGYELRIDPDHIDSHRFERLVNEGRRELEAGHGASAASVFERALSMLRGPPLEDLGYERFAHGEIARLDDLRLAAVELLIDAKLGLGRHAEVVGELEALIAETPYREHLRAQLMLALYRCDRQADALQAYQDARRKLVDELGIEPGERLRELEQAILAQEPALAIVDDGRTSAVAAAPPRGEELIGTAAGEVLVGREEHLHRLREGLETALRGRGAVFIIGGEAGIGKTRLADELAREARERGADVLWGRCWEMGGAPAYWPWVQVLRSLLHEHRHLNVGSLGGAGAAALAELMPELNRSRPELPPAAADAEGARFQLFDAVAWLLRESAEVRPVVIVIDDLHAADTPSLLLLQFLAGQLASSRLVIAGLYREDGVRAGGPLTACLTALAREPTTSRMRLTGLSAAQTAELIESITGRGISDAASLRICAETDGNPLFVGEIVRLLLAEGGLDATIGEPDGAPPLPDTVTEVIGQRLQHLGTSCRQLLSSAAILGREFGLNELSAVSDIADDGLLSGLDEARAARVLEPASAGDRVRFSHALVRETLYGAIAPTQRREGHRRAGEALETLYALNLQGHLAELAHHFFQALPTGDPARAVEYAQRAGDRAGKLLAYEEAVRLYRLALRALDLEGGGVDARRCALLLALGDAQARAGDEHAARATFLQAAGIATDAGLPRELATAALGYGGRFVWARAGTDVDLIPLLEDALRLLPADASALRVKLMARLAGASRDHRSRERRASLSAQAVEIARRLDDPATLAFVLDGRYSALMRPENAEQRLKIADEIVSLAEHVADSERAIQGRIYRVIANLELGRMTEAETNLEITAERAAALRQPAQLWFAAAMRAVIALFRGRFGEAERLMNDALALGERAQRRDAVLSHRLQLFMLSRETGRLAEVEELMERAVSDFPARPVFRCALACLQADLDHTDQARRLVKDLAEDDFSVIQQDNEYLFSLSFLADAVTELGEIRAAAVLYDLLAPHAHLNASNADELATGSVSRPLGVLATTMSRYDHAVRHFDAAISQNAAMGARPWVAHSRHDYARMLLARDGDGDRNQAQTLLASAHDEYVAMGMATWAQRTRELLPSS